MLDINCQEIGSGNRVKSRFIGGSRFRDPPASDHEDLPDAHSGPHDKTLSESDLEVNLSVVSYCRAFNTNHSPPIRCDVNRWQPIEKASRRRQRQSTARVLDWCQQCGFSLTGSGLSGFLRKSVSVKLVGKSCPQTFLFGFLLLSTRESVPRARTEGIFRLRSPRSSLPSAPERLEQ